MSGSKRTIERMAWDKLADHIQPLLTYGSGKIVYVDANATGAANTNSGSTPGNPKATLNSAVDACEAGDIIVLLPGHTETIDAADDVDIDLDNIAVIGLGFGDNRPTFSLAATTAAMFVIAGDGVLLENVVFTGDIDALAKPVQVSGDGCVLRNIEYRDVTGQATDVFELNDANRCLVDGMKFFGAAADGPDTAIVLTGADDVEICNSYFYGNFDLGAIECRTTKCLRLNIHDCKFWTEGSEDLAIKDTVTASTGSIGPNLYIRLKDDAANITTAITGATFHVFDPVYVVNADDEKAMLIDWTASTNA